MREQHDIDFGRVFESGFLTAREQFVQIWCRRHGRYEWHWVAAGGDGQPAIPSAGVGGGSQS